MKPLRNCRGFFNKFSEVKPFPLLIVLILINHLSFSQRGDILIKSVLKKNERNKAYVFDSSDRKKDYGYYKIYITYLGNVRINDTLAKIVIVKTVFGVNRHTSGTIFLYNDRNHFWGKYGLGDGLDLPAKIEKNQLIFPNKNKRGCDPTIVTQIDFSKEIPSPIFLKCEGKLGDLYWFSRIED